MHASPADLSDDQLAALARLGYPETPELLGAALPYVHRDRDLALLAAEGSGREALYALAAVEQCDPTTTEAQALILTSTRETALRAARAGYELAGPAGLDALAWSAGEQADAEVPPLAQIVAGRPDDLLEATGAGRLSLAEVELVVLDGVDLLDSAGQWESVDALLEAGADDAQRIAASGRNTERFQEVATRRLRRAQRWPRELFEAAGGEGTAGDLHVAAAGSEEARIDRLGDALHGALDDVAPEDEDGVPEPTEIFVHCPDRGTAERVASGLAARGFRLSNEPGEAGVAVLWGVEEEPEADIVARFGLPPGLEEARRWLGDAARRIAVVEPRHRRQLALLARRAGWTLKAVAERIPASYRDEIDRLREEIGRRADRVDPVEMLLLEPLFQSHGATEVAAALSGWIREDLPEEKLPGAARATPEPSGGAERAGKPAAGGRERQRRRPRGERGRPDRKKARARSAKPQKEGAWTSLFIKVGEEDGVGPGDLVGAITGETDAVGSQIGKIDIRETYSLVQVDPDVADHVIRELSGSTIRGRKAEVRRDRKQ
ncbi:MAG: DbpA RNA binding domain-containing protein [Candidatus Palauibacterales bacterium]|nr:DbpA RNA binding domain-containing protein [Candidatus Palauibacterales bacterium]